MRLTLVNQFYDCSSEKEKAKINPMKTNESNSLQMVNKMNIKINKVSNNGYKWIHNNLKENGTNVGFIFE